MKQLNKPTGLCTCGHTGGPNSQHLGLTGHGACTGHYMHWSEEDQKPIEHRCPCPQFTWKSFLPGIVEEFRKGGKS